MLPFCNFTEDCAQDNAEENQEHAVQFQDSDNALISASLRIKDKKRVCTEYSPDSKVAYPRGYWNYHRVVTYCVMSFQQKCSANGHPCCVYHAQAQDIKFCDCCWTDP